MYNMEKILENECLRVVITPGFGGKITSLFHKENLFEAAAQLGDKERMISRQGFARYAYGMDDAFPNIDAEELLWNGRKRRYPDHGEIWNADFTVLSQGQDFVRMVWESETFSYRYEKEVYLLSNMLALRYHITNIGEEELPAIFTWHGLMRYEEDMEILLPKGVGQCQNVLSERILGAPDTVYPYDNPVHNFCRVPPADSFRAIKYYLEPGEEEKGKPNSLDDFLTGREESLTAISGLYYPSQGMYCMLHYDVKKLPYLGVWITAGGFESDYNCALEPSNGFYDGIGRAAENRRLPVLAPGEAMDFELLVSLSGKCL